MGGRVFIWFQNKTTIDPTLQHSSMYMSAGEGVVSCALLQPFTLVFTQLFIFTPAM